MISSAAVSLSVSERMDFTICGNVWKVIKLSNICGFIFCFSICPFAVDAMNLLWGLGLGGVLLKSVINGCCSQEGFITSSLKI